MDIAHQLYEKAFTQPRDPRSDAYKRGVRDALQACARQSKTKLGALLPYEMGTAEADAWFAGTEEGKNRWRWHLDEQKDQQQTGAA